MNYIEKLERCEIFNSGFVELWDFSNTSKSEQGRIEAVSVVSNSVFGQNGKIINAQRLYERIKREAAMNTPGRPFQFVPIVIKVSKFLCIRPFKNFEFYKYGTFVKKKHRYFCTNLRNYLKYNRNDVILDKIEDHENIYSNFKVFKLKVPMFVRDQLMTHTTLSKVNQSNRVGKKESMEFYIPADLKERTYQFYLKQKHNKLIAHSINNKSSLEVFDQHFLKSGIQAGQKRLQNVGYSKELYSRFPNQLKYGIMWIAGWYDDPNGLYNLFLQRNTIQDKWKNWTQHETFQYVKMMKELTEKHHK